MARRKKAHDVYDLGYILQNICIILYWLTGSSSHEIDNKTRHFYVSNVLHLSSQSTTREGSIDQTETSQLAPASMLAIGIWVIEIGNINSLLFGLPPFNSLKSGFFFPVIYSTSISETETKRTRLIIGRTKLMAARTKQTRWEREGAKEVGYIVVFKRVENSVLRVKKAPRKKSSPVSKKSYPIRSFRFSPVTDFFSLSAQLDWLFHLPFSHPLNSRWDASQSFQFQPQIESLVTNGRRCVCDRRDAGRANIDVRYSSEMDKSITVTSFISPAKSLASAG
jgi:hypothetical protein